MCDKARAGHYQGLPIIFYIFCMHIYYRDAIKRTIDLSFWFCNDNKFRFIVSLLDKFQGWIHCYSLRESSSSWCWDLSCPRISSSCYCDFFVSVNFFKMSKNSKNYRINKFLLFVAEIYRINKFLLVIAEIYHINKFLLVVAEICCVNKFFLVVTEAVTKRYWFSRSNKHNCILQQKRLYNKTWNHWADFKKRTSRTSRKSYV